MRPDRDNATDNAHLYQGLGQTPSAHADPPASVAGPTGLRAAATPARVEPGYDAPRPRRGIGGGAKLLLGGGAIVGAALVVLLLKLGLWPGGGSGGVFNPTLLVQPGQTTQPATSPAASGAGMATSVPAAPLHLTIVNETFHVGAADGKEVSLDEAVALAKSATANSPAVIDLIDSSRQAAKEKLRTALEQQQIPILWTRDGKPVSGDLPGKVPAPADADGK